ncbi:hypothetical protein BP5796_05199 [Coleophoma crateriformis]|uniref:Gamma interferon inducible lysosomal thiol reductase n=1 Tax=Coleophoma crateriformis TaxID=565419 RepID=A0A3D8S327_9HELO|nr:hypothetical protein BP5796_05199 [Coleophoma crateriformis]
MASPSPATAYLHDQKTPLVDSAQLQDEFERHPKMLPARRNKAFAAGVLLVGFLYLVWNVVFMCLSGDMRAGAVGQAMMKLEKSPSVAVSRAVVPFEAHIMSKCPDAQDCLKLMVLPAMQRVYDKVNFTLSYIGTPTDNDGVDCKHGPAECMGNIIELCAASLYPDPKIYLGFTMCLTRDYKEIPDRSLVEDCALEHGMDFDSLNDCTVRDDGGFGVGMLRDSVRRTTQVT